MRYLVVSHDAGGAEVLSAWVKENNDRQYDFLLEGPAVKIFSEKLSGLDGCQLIEEGVLDLSCYNFILTSTSWSSDLEKRYLQLAKERKIKSASYLDHWVNYRERFLQRGKLILPDEIWVGDSVAEKLAREEFKNDLVKILFVENQYIKNLKQQAIEKKKTETFSIERKILYLCEPLAEHVSGMKLGFDEFTLMDSFLNQLISAKTLFPFQIKIRLHPSEKFNKYEEILKKFSNKLNIKMNKESLLEDCVWADQIIGISSMAMMVGHFLDRPVYKLPALEGSSYYSLPVHFPNFLPAEKRFSTERLMFEPFSEYHLTEHYVAWLNDPEVVRYSEQRHVHHTIESCRHYLKSFDGTSSLFYAIISKDYGHVGNINAYVDLNNAVADIGILIGAKTVWGKGYGLEAWEGMCSYLFSLGMRKITAGTMSNNKAMMKILEKSRACIEGSRKSQYVWEGQLVDMVYAAQFNSQTGRA